MPIGQQGGRAWVLTSSSDFKSGEVEMTAEEFWAPRERADAQCARCDLPVVFSFLAGSGIRIEDWSGNSLIA